MDPSGGGNPGESSSGGSGGAGGSYPAGHAPAPAPPAHHAHAHAHARAGAAAGDPAAAAAPPFAQAVAPPPHRPRLAVANGAAMRPAIVAGGGAVPPPHAAYAQLPQPQPQQPQVAYYEYQTLRCAVAIAAQLAETHRLLGGSLRGDLDLPAAAAAPGPAEGIGAAKTNGSSSGSSSSRYGDASAIVPSVKTALLREETLRKRFEQYYVPPTTTLPLDSNVMAAAAAAAGASGADAVADRESLAAAAAATLSALPLPCRGHSGAARIATAARVFEVECVRQHTKQMQKRQKRLQKERQAQDQAQAESRQAQADADAAALWTAQQGTKMSLSGISLLQRYLDSLLKAVQAECQTLLYDANFVEKILGALAKPPHAKTFDPTSMERMGQRLSSIKVAASMALRRGGEEGCELERVASMDMRLAGSGQTVVPALWRGREAPIGVGGLSAHGQRGRSIGPAGQPVHWNPSTPATTKGGSKGKRKRSASKKMIEAENDAAYEQRMDMERKMERQRQRSKVGGSGGSSGGKKKKNGKKPSPRSSPKFPHPSTANKTLPGYSGGSSPEAAASGTGTANGSGSKRQQAASSSSSRLGFGRDVPPRPSVTIVDSNPSRITNPLLSVPLYPRGVTGPNGTSTAPGRSSIVTAARVAGMMGGDTSSSNGAAAGKGGDIIGGPMASGAAAAMGVEGVSVGAAGLPFRPDLIPHGGEMWGVMELYDPKIVDTFPLSYMARLLGFDVPHSVPESDVAATAENDVAALFAGSEMEPVVEAVMTVAKRKEGKSTERNEIKPFQKFDPSTLKLMKSNDDIWMSVPELGQFASMIRSNKRRRIDGPNDTSTKNDVDDFFDLDVIDPMWRAILSDRTLVNGGSEVKIRQAEYVNPPMTTTKAAEIAGADTETKATESSSAPVPAALLDTVAPTGTEPTSESSALVSSNAKAFTENTDDDDTSANFSKQDGRVPLTTNTPREVEAVDPKTNVRIHLFDSCSDAARITRINRNKISRTCLEGGGILESNSHGTLLYRYTETANVPSGAGDASGLDSEEASPEGEVLNPALSKPLAVSDACSTTKASSSKAAGGPLTKPSSPADKLAVSSSTFSLRVVPITFGVQPNVKLANGSYYQFISDQCLNCAKELVVGPFAEKKTCASDASSPDERVMQLLREGRITFRIATVGDEELLYRLNVNKTRFYSVADYAYALRSGHFFIIALEKIPHIPSAGGDNGSEDASPSPGFAPLGYVHYTFCWYKIGAIPKEDAGPSASDQTSALYGVPSTTSSIKPSTVSELVFGLDEIQCAPQGIAIREGQSIPQVNRNSTSTTVGCDFLPIILTALALEHVRGNDIWYGIANVTTSFEAQLLKKYFRMTPLLSSECERNLSADDGYPLACDMKKSSSRFAFLRYLDEHRQRVDTSASTTKKKSHADPAVRERMLVRLPDAKTLQASLKMPSTNSVDTTANASATAPSLPAPQSVSVGTVTTIQISLADSSAAPSADVPNDVGEIEKNNQGVAAIDTAIASLPASAVAAASAHEAEAALSSGPTLSFTSASTNLRTKTVGVRVSLSAVDEVKAGQPRVQLLSDGNQTSPVKDEQFVNNPTWKVLKTFELPGTSSESAKATSTSPSTNETLDESMNKEDGTILADLLCKQDELRELEDSFEPKLRSLLNQAYEERVAYEAKERVEERAQAKISIRKYEAEISRKREADAAWQAQLEQDMDAVCDICLDGDVTVDNQILFCESCNVAIHQACYGIPRVPAGDYFCKACLHFGRDKEARAQASRTAVAATAAHLRHKPLKICCELCPRRQGAFVRATWDGEKESDNPNKAKWVHVTCSKWFGLSYRDEVKQDVIVDAVDVRDMFRNHDEYYQCCLCESGRGAFNKCEEVDCNNWVHVQCARLSGTCRVIHGENCYGKIEIENPDLLWKVFCPLHSNIAADDVPKGSLSKEQLKAAANTFPPEPRRPPPPDAFDRLSGKDRAKFWADPTRQKQMIERLTGMVEGARCAVCNIIDPTDQFDASGRSRNRLARCNCCGVVVHRACYMGPPPRSEKEFVCQACQYVAEEKDKEKYELPQCHMCNMKGGVLRKAYAIPGSKKRFKGDQKRFEQTLFGKQIWCHTICAMWSHHVEYTLADDINCSQLIMANGTSHIGSKYHCDLCGRKDGVKFSCTMKECHKSGGAMVPYRFHLSCGRQAGLDIHDADNDTQGFYIKCFHHVRCSEVVRARMEDMLEVEKRRCGKMLEKAAMPMPFRDAAQLMHWSVTILANLGWAWRWADWWVERGDNWEPLLEPGQKEEKMTKEQLKIVDSTPQSRCTDARKCRLAAFGAALRNRDYDKEEGDDTIALDKALRAILDTPSLVGPLLPHEKDFYAEWLGRAYRSKSPLLGFGDNKIPIDKDFCTHIEDKSPKYMLGSRPLPGKPLPEGFTEVDDFLRIRPEPIEQSPPPKRGGTSKKRSMVEDGGVSVQPRRWSSRAKAPVKHEQEPDIPLDPSPKKAKRGPDANGKYRRPHGRAPAGKIWDYDTGEWVAEPEIEATDEPEAKLEAGPEAKLEPEHFEEEASSILAEGGWTCLKCGLANARGKGRCKCKAWPPKKSKSPSATVKRATINDRAGGNSNTGEKLGTGGQVKSKKGKALCRVDGCVKFKQANCDDMCRAHWKESLETKE